MNRRLLVVFICGLMMAAAAPPPARALSPGCDQCADLPALYRELLEQEFLRNRFDRWVREAYYPISIAEMQRIAVNALNAAMAGDLYGVLAPTGTGAATGGAAPAYGTDLEACGLVQYVKDKDGKQVQRPVTPGQVRSALCKPLAEYTLVHEEHHQKTCRAGGLKTVEQFAKDDREAYQAGIGVLRRHIADLAGRCGWSGSSSGTKPDGTATVPTPPQIASLKDATKAKANLLNRATR